MIVDEIMGVFEGICHTYNTEEFDFVKTHSMPLFFIEGAGIGSVSDVETFTRVFNAIINCSQYLHLPKIEFHLQRFLALSDFLVIAVVRWTFS